MQQQRPVQDISSKLEQKRIEYERQREAQKRAFEEQMILLEMQQRAEEQELIAHASRSATPSAENKAENKPPSPATVPVRSRSGNDLVSFANTVTPIGTQAESVPANEAPSGTKSTGISNPARKKVDFSSELSTKSMPASRRHSGEIGRDFGTLASGPDPARRRRDGEPMLNSFLFDDELDADLQSSAWGGKYLQMNTDDDKFPILLTTNGNQLSASSAALDLAPLSQAPHHPVDSFGPPGSRLASSEWPQFTKSKQELGPLSVSGPTTNTPPGSAHLLDRHRSPVDAPAAVGVVGDRSSPHPRGANSQLPHPLSRGAVSGRSSPAVDKKLTGLDSNKSNIKQFPASDLAGSYTVDSLSENFSNFTIDPSAAFGAGYNHDHGPFGFEGGASANRFAGLRLEDLQGDMLPLCKDQFGCRYLQKKLEDGNPEHRDMIFNEIFPHFAELMTDPFANYLSQRLLEYCTDEQRDVLIESISGELVSISLNMHGTRAVQKMIDFLSTKRQVQSLILALNLNVVTLIKDLNGNHVIQKCLNQLPPEDNQFIYNAVATHCIEVATHRHGCCVLQRCIDHASESQRIQLVTEITYNSLTLVQDAFGNYVVQYVLDLNDNRFIEAIVRQFLGNVAALSAQKFSSNVVEKCIRVADSTARRAIIEELLNKQRLERLLRDSFANYVVQTALDYAEPSQRAQLIETIRPILPMIRNTPYGKRIQSKIQRETNDHMGRGGYHHQMVPNGPFYNFQSMPPPQQYLQHPVHHMGPAPMGEFGARGAFVAGYQGAPPPQHLHGPQHHPSGSIPGTPGPFAPFPGMPSMDYPGNNMSSGAYSGYTGFA